MQIVESEIVIPLKRRPDPKGMVAFLVTVLVLTVGEFIYFVTIQMGHAKAGGTGFPAKVCSSAASSFIPCLRNVER
jgi:hypothetical protein